MGRKPCCSKDAGLNRGAWTPMEDKILAEYIEIHGEGNWRSLPERSGKRPWIHSMKDSYSTLFDTIHR